MPMAQGGGVVARGGLFPFADGLWLALVGEPPRASGVPAADCSVHSGSVYCCWRGDSHVPQLPESRIFGRKSGDRSRFCGGEIQTLSNAMRRRKDAYELSRCQVDTPDDVVSAFWRIIHRYRRQFSAVLDMGAGDGRFAFGGGHFREYVGVEIDPARAPARALPSSARIVYECAFRHAATGYAACIGNPPYVRHHDLEPEWRDRIAGWITRTTGHPVNRKCNLYVYFLFLGLLKSRTHGLVATIVPYEWVSRPAAAPLRAYIQANRWQVDTFRFSDPIFPSVETTAAISVIDKRRTTGAWNFFELQRDGTARPLPSATGSKRSVLRYTDRGPIWAMRGISPGTQAVFTLTEGERIHAGLLKNDVCPCITSLRKAPPHLSTLTRSVFQRRFVDEGLKCWLIRTDKPRLSERLQEYLSAIPPELRATATCLNRAPWYRFQLPDPPDMLVSSGFVGAAPKALLNSVGACAVGGVHGVYDVPFGMRRKLQRSIVCAEWASRVVAHSGNLKKIEIRQLNWILREFCRKHSITR